MPHRYDYHDALYYTLHNNHELLILVSHSATYHHGESLFFVNYHRDLTTIEKESGKESFRMFYELIGNTAIKPNLPHMFLPALQTPPRYFFSLTSYDKYKSNQLFLQLH